MIKNWAENTLVLYTWSEMFPYENFNTNENMKKMLTNERLFGAYEAEMIYV